MRILYTKVVVLRKAKVEVEVRESSRWDCVIDRLMSNEEHVQQAVVY